MIEFVAHLDTYETKIPTELEDSGSIIQISEEEWEWLREKLENPETNCVLTNYDPKASKLSHYYQQWH